MRAAVLKKINTPLAICEVGLTNLSFGQVLVKILVSGICGAQLQEIYGHKGNEKYTPHLMGHEGCGIVDEIGPGVTKVKKGDKVIMHWRKGEGIESDFPKYILEGQEISSGKITTFSEYSIVSENRITPVPQNTPNELCALLGCSLSTAIGTITNEAMVTPGESVLIVGAGGLGLSSLLAAKLVSAYPIIISDVNAYKDKLCKSLGVDLYVDIKKEDILEKVKNELGIKEIDVIIDTSGNKESLEKTIPLLSGKGRYILIAQPKPGESIEIKNAHHLFGGEGKMLKATQGGKFSPSTQIRQYINLYNAGLLNIDNLITHRITLDEINQAVELLKTGEAGRIIINM